MGKKDRKIDLGGSEGGLTHNPFAALRAGDSGNGGDGPVDPVTPSDVTENVDRDDLSGSHVVVRRERKGRGGKTVTVVSWRRSSDPDEAALRGLARDLAKGLGAGVRVEDGELVVQGDMVERVAIRLEEDLDARVVRGT